MGDLVILIFLLGEEGNLRGVSSGRGKWGSTLPHFPCLQGLVELPGSGPQSSQDLEHLESILAEKLRQDHSAILSLLPPGESESCSLLQQGAPSGWSKRAVFSATHQGWTDLDRGTKL